MSASAQRRGREECSARRVSAGAAVVIGCALALGTGASSAAQEGDSLALQSDRGPAPLPSVRELAELVAYAEPVAKSPHAVRLESFRADTINGVYLVDSDLPSARHVAFGRDSEGRRYVWFSRRNPLRASLVALYDVDGTGGPDILYWRQIDFASKLARPREFRAPAARDVTFEYSSATPCGRATCEEGWRELALERIAVPETFLESVAGLFRDAARHGEPYVDRPVASLQQLPKADPGTDLPRP